MARVLSGIQPTGDIHLGNYLGAVRNWVDDQHTQDSYFCVVDLHAITVPRDPAELRAKTLELTLLLVAAGLDPDVCTLFVQSHVHEHAELSWILECVASMGELRRMTQFKEKAKDGEESARVGLFTYPVLQAADILLYDADRVPVGEDQRQHLELCRDIALRFNHRYGETFVVPEAVLPKVGARIMDLQKPTAKMSKSADSPQGTVLVLDEPDVIARKFKRAVTDTGTEVVFDPEKKPGVANLLAILAAAVRPPAGGRGRGLLPVRAPQGRHRRRRHRAGPAGAASATRRWPPIPRRCGPRCGGGRRRRRRWPAPTLARAQDAIGLLSRH